MALDCLKDTYLPHKPRTTTKTSYAKMNQWVAVQKQEEARSRVVDLNLRNPANIAKLFMEERKLKNEMRRIANERGYDPQRMSKRTPLSSGRLFSAASFTPHYRKEAFPSLEKIGVVKIPQLDALRSTPVHAQYYQSGGYDDWHKTNLKQGNSQEYDLIYGPKKLRNGRVGGTWRHVKEVLQSGGSRIVFVDGTTSIDDKSRRQTLELGGATPRFDPRWPNSSELAEARMKERKEQPLHLTSYYSNVAAVKGTEKANWQLLR